MAPLHRTLSNHFLSKLPPFRPSWPRVAQFSAAVDRGPPAPVPSSAAATPPPLPYESSPPIDAGPSIRRLISLWPGTYFSPITNALWEARSKMFEEVGGAATGEQIGPAEPGHEQDEHFLQVVEGLCARGAVQESLERDQDGKLVEDLDALARTICYKVNERAFNDYRMAIP